MLTTIIIDDEEDNRITLRDFLTMYCPGVKIVAEADTIDKAVEQITDKCPDLVFLDINMPYNNGFSLFSKVPDADFFTIFVTAHEEHAIQAIKHRAVDYILKPVSIIELIRAVGLAKDLHDKKMMARQMSQLWHPAPVQPITINSEKICLPLLDGFSYVQVSDIIRCEADGNYTIFHFTDREKMVVCHSLGIYETKLRQYGFLRVHNQHLVNVKHIEKYKRGRGGIIYMSDKKEVAVSQRKRDEFLKLVRGSLGEDET